MKKKVAIVFTAFVAVTVFLTGCQREDQPWPSRAIQVVIPFSPGGDTDINARQYIMHLGQVLGVPVVGQNIIGQAGAVGATHVMNAAPDGYTVLIYQTTMFLNRAAGVSTLNLDQFEVVAIAAQGDFAVVVQAESPFHTLQDLIDASVAAPEGLIFAMNIGATSQLTGVLLNQAGADMRLVDVGDGAQRVTSLMGGHIHAIPTAFGPVMPHLEAGAFRALAIVNTERNIVLTEVPTTVELGFPDAVIPIFYFFLFPRGTPNHIVDGFADALQQVHNMEAYQRGIVETFQQTPFFLRGEAAAQALRAQEAWAYTFRDALRE